MSEFLCEKCGLRPATFNSFCNNHNSFHGFCEECARDNVRPTGPLASLNQLHEMKNLENIKILNRRERRLFQLNRVVKNKNQQQTQSENKS